MGKNSGLLNTTEIFSLLHLQFFLFSQITRSVRISNQFIFDILWVLMGFSAESGKNLPLGIFSDLKLNTRIPTKKI